MHASSLGREQPRRREPDSTLAPGDEGDLLRQSGHGHLSSSRSTDARKIMVAPMSSSDLTIRAGGDADGQAVVNLFDEAVAWLVDRGQTGQWGATPFAERPGLRERVHGFRIGGGLYIAERHDVPIGVLVVGPSPPYAT